MIASDAVQRRRWFSERARNVLEVIQDCPAAASDHAGRTRLQRSPFLLTPYFFYLSMMLTELETLITSCRQNNRQPGGRTSIYLAHKDDEDDDE